MTLEQLNVNRTIEVDPELELRILMVLKDLIPERDDIERLVLVEYLKKILQEGGVLT